MKLSFFFKKIINTVNVFFENIVGMLNVMEMV